MPKRTGRSTRIDFDRKRFGVTKWQYDQLNEIDLLIEIGILSNCKMIGSCRVCRHLLRFCIDILMKKWDEFRFINFFDPMKIIKNNEKMFKTSIVLNHYTDNRKLLKKIVRQSRIEKNHYELIRKHKDSFIESIENNEKLKAYLHNLVGNTDPI